MARFDLTDAQWERLQPLLPPEHSGKPGHPYCDHRRVINGILWVLHTGAPWADLPERYGPHQTAYDRYVRWRNNGVWATVLSTLQAQTDAEGRLQWAYAAVDGTIIPVHPNAATRGAYAKDAAEDAAEKGGATADEQSEKTPDEIADEAIGASRGGPTTKIHLVADMKARPLGFDLSVGQRNDCERLAQALDTVRIKRPGRGRPRKRPDDLYMDKGYSYGKCRQLLRRRGIRHLIPEREDQQKQRQKKGSNGGRPCAYDRVRYACRNVVERCALRLQQFRRVATRYDKREINYRTTITIAAIILWLR